MPRWAAFAGGCLGELAGGAGGTHGSLDTLAAADTSAMQEEE